MFFCSLILGECMKKILLGFAILSILSVLFSANDAAAKIRRVKKSQPPISLKAAPESLARQNQIIDAYGLPRIADSQELARFLPEHFFVKVSSPHLEMTDEVGGYAILPVRDFIVMFGGRFYEIFHKKLKIPSILRPCDIQEELLRKKKTIADCETPGKQSAHLTGIALDISRLPMTPREIWWIRKELAAYMWQRKIIAVEEGKRNNTFHVMVCPNWQTGSCF